MANVKIQMPNQYQNGLSSKSLDFGFDWTFEPCY